MTKKIPREGVAPSHLTVLIGKELRKVVVPMKKEGLIIGRNTKKGKVDLDLNPYDGLEMGVSREHIQISPKRDYLIVKDLESANSTWHNRLRMKPMVAEELYHGDTLHLGEMRLEIIYTYADELKAEHQTQVLGDLGQTKQFDTPSDLPATKPDTRQLKNPSQQSGATRRFEDE